MQTLIRTAIPEDIPALCDLLAALFEIESDFTPDREKQKKALGMLIDDQSGSGAILVAVMDNLAIGMCSVQKVISTAEGGPAGLVEDLIVREEYRGKGIATKLLDDVRKWCRANGITRIQLLADKNNARAFEFYANRGWIYTDLVCLRKHP